MKKFINEDSIRIFISTIIFVICLFIENYTVKVILSGIAYVIISMEVWKEGLSNLWEKQFFDENILMMIASICAFLIGSIEEAVMVMLLFEVGEYLSDLAVNNSKKSITKLLDLRVSTANLLIDEKIVPTDIKEIKVGALLVVKPGEKIPLDGIVVEGESHLDTSSLTGESLPRKVSKNMEVLSGCVNEEKVLTIKATTTYKTTTATKIIELIENSDSKKANAEKFITKFARIYTPVVVFSALLLVLVPTILGQDFKTWLYRALVFLVTSCPCALVISVPLGYFCGIGKASREKILIKGSKELESMSNVDYIVFDKTGTITEGVFEVRKVSSESLKESYLLQIAASAEEYSLHPIGIAIKNKNKKDKLPVKKYKELSGKGISCEVDDKKVLIGNSSLLTDNNIAVPKLEEDSTTVYIAIDNEYAGYIIISDKIKESSKHLAALKEYINKDLVILSGDTKKAVENIAKEVGINNYYNSLLPQDKVSQVEKLKEAGKVMFVGDGVNDSPVLKIADIGVSMGQLGSDAAIEASDVVLMKDDLMKIKTAILISRYTKRKTKQSIIFSLSVKLVVLILGAMGISTIWMAVFADVGVTLLAVLNVLTIMWKKFD